MNSAVPEDALLVLRERLLDQDPAVPDEAAAPASLRHELRGLLTLSAPVMVQLSAQYAVTVINQYFIGHQGAGPLAAAAIGNTVCQLVNLVRLRTTNHPLMCTTWLRSGSTCVGTF